MALRDGFHKAIEQYHQAQKEFVRGNPQPFKALCSHADDVTIIGGWGGVEKGWNAQVEKRYDWASARFATDDDERRVENISTVVTPGMAYTVDIERTKIRLAGAQEAAAHGTTSNEHFPTGRRAMEARASPCGPSRRGPAGGFSRSEVK